MPTKYFCGICGKSVRANTYCKIASEKPHPVFGWTKVERDSIPELCESCATIVWRAAKRRAKVLRRKYHAEKKS